MRTLWSETIFGNSKSSKVMKMRFISPQKLFSLSRYFGFFLDFLVMQQNGLIRKINFISNFMTSQPGQQRILIHILRNISRSKSNQTMTFGQLIECNTRNIFLENLYKKYYGETSPRPFSEKIKLGISLNHQPRVCYSLFLLHVKFGVIETY